MGGGPISAETDMDCSRNWLEGIVCNCGIGLIPKGRVLGGCDSGVGNL